MMLINRFGCRRNWFPNYCFAYLTATTVIAQALIGVCTRFNIVVPRAGEISLENFGEERENLYICVCVYASVCT